MSHLSQEIEFFIENALNGPYNPRVGKSVFLCDERSVVSGRFTNYKKSLTLEIPACTDTSRFKSRCFRLPQSRIFVTIVEDSCTRLLFIDFFEQTVIVVRRYHDKVKTISLNLIHANRLLTANREPLTDVHNTYYWKDVSEDLVVFCGPQAPETIRSVPVILNRLYSDEKKNHPLASLRSSDLTFMETVDKLWSHITCIGPDREVAFSEKKDLSPEEAGSLFWLRELYCYLGWFEEANKMSRTNPDVFDTITPDKGPFFSIYTRGIEDERELPADDLESYWMAICNPSKNGYLQELITQKPDELMAFSFLALRLQFWWHDTLFERIDGALKTMESAGIWKIWKLLFLLQRRYFIAHKGDWYRLMVSGREENTAFEAGAIGLQHLKRKSGKTTVFQFKDIFSITVNQDVVLAYNRSRNEVELVPHTEASPFFRSRFSTAILKHNSLFIRIPLAWRQFEIQADGLRLKFLLKKKRFQITVRKTDPGQVFELDHYRSGSDKTERYIKLYRQVQTVDPVVHCRIYDDLGNKLSTFGRHISLVQPVIIAVDRRGVLCESAQFKINSPSKGQTLMRNRRQGDFLSVTERSADIHINAGHGASRNMQLPAQTGIFYRFLVTPSLFLSQQMMILYEDLADNQISAIRKTVFNSFSFYPVTVHFHMKWLKCRQFHFVIREEEEADIVLKRDLFSLARKQPSGKTFYFLIHPENAVPFFNKMYTLFLNEI